MKYILPRIITNNDALGKEKDKDDYISNNNNTKGKMRHLHWN